MLFFVRHGQTHWNRDQRLQGQLDSPLTLKGIRQVVAYGQYLAKELDGRKPVLWASPLGRAVQSAGIVAEHLHIAYDDIRFDGRLRERNQGVFDGLTRDEIAAQGGPSGADRKSWTYAAPGGESFEQVFMRAQEFLHSVADESLGVIVAHGVVSRMMRAAYLGLTPDQVSSLDRHEQDRLFRMAEGRVERVVCAAHI